MADIRVVGADELDLAAFVALMREAYAEIIKETGTGYLFTDAYYRWKYAPPAGRARIALVVDAGEPVAANSMYPLAIRSRTATVAGWQSCDTATHPRARGKGYFMKCLAALRDSLKDETVFFGFPNKNSTPGFLKFGWTHHSDVRTRVRLLPGRRMEAFRRVERVSSFGASHDPFAAALAEQAGAALDRSAAYLNWRYFQHPLHQYEAFAWMEDGRQLGLVVLRVVTVKERRFAVAMELLALEGRVERGLLRFAKAWAKSKGVGIAMVLNTTTGAGRALLCGYVPVPMWALPKRQVLMGAASGAAAERMWREPWRVQIGDWDGF